MPKHVANLKNKKKSHSVSNPRKPSDNRFKRKTDGAKKKIVKKNKKKK